MPLNFRDVRRVLCVGAHADDIEIGCGGVLMDWIGRAEEIEICWVVLSGDARRRAEAEASCAAFCEGAAECEFIGKSFHDSFFPYEGEQIKSFFHELAHRVQPDVIFTHHHADRHQDHRLVNELTWNAFRGPTILEYEIPKWEGDLGQPNLFVPLEAELAERKISALFKYFPSQRDKPWFDRETFAALLRLRGLECNAPSRYAEAFHARKLILG